MNQVHHVGVMINPGKQNLLPRARTIISWLEDRNIHVMMPLTEPFREHFGCYLATVEQVRESADLIISLGGDGTLCRSAREYSTAGVPVLGINLGGLGFLTEIPLDTFGEGLQAVCSGECLIEERIMLEANILRDGKQFSSYLALNDVVISKSSLPRTISLETFVSGDLVTTYSADGIIISSPTGSTAYSLSAGGAIVDPRLDVILISPICAHTLSVRPLIISGDETVCVSPKAPFQDILLTVDGQECHTLRMTDKVEVCKSPSRARLVRLRHKKSFFETLRTKLGWSGITAKGT